MKWQYLLLTYDSRTVRCDDPWWSLYSDEFPRGDLPGALRVLGAHSWELVSVITERREQRTDNYVIYGVVTDTGWVFKRPVDDEAAAELVQAEEAKRLDDVYDEIAAQEAAEYQAQRAQAATAATPQPLSQARAAFFETVKAEGLSGRLRTTPPSKLTSGDICLYRGNDGRWCVANTGRPGKPYDTEDEALDAALAALRSLR